MIIYRTGDVVEAFKKGEIDVLIHQTNCRGVMGSGIAKQIKAQLPAAYEAYKTKEFYEGLNLGEFSYADVVIQERELDMPELRGLVINLNAQYDYKDRSVCNTNYAALGKALFDSENVIPKYFRIGMPKIGAGLGGGDWKVIEAIINSHFPDRDIFVYTLEDKKTDGRNDNA